MEADPGSPDEAPAAAGGVTDSFSQLWSDVMGMLVSLGVLSPYTGWGGVSKQL